jgi:hypothetical protein
VERSGGKEGNIEHNHIQAEDAQTRWEGQVDFMETLSTTTYTLRRQRKGGKVRWTSRKH